MHGRPQTFFQGRAKFSGGGGQKTTIGLKKHLKNTILAGQGGQGPPLALPCGRPWFDGTVVSNA